jgi:hypothetical protein
VTTQKNLEKIPSGISVTTQKSLCVVTHIPDGIFSRLLCYHRYSRWYLFHTLLKATYYAAVTGFMCCHRYSDDIFSLESRKNTIWNICDNTEESGKNPIWNICDNT